MEEIAEGVQLKRVHKKQQGSEKPILKSTTNSVFGFYCFFLEFLFERAVGKLVG